MAPSTLSETTTTTTTTPVGNIPDAIKASTTKGYAAGERGAHNISLGADIPFPIPKFDDPYKQRDWMLEHMAGAFRIFARKGYTEGGAGHISIRDPVDPKTFWINPLGIHFGVLKASDMVHIDEDANIIGGNRVAVNAAGFAIHSALHKARPDVNAACHTHSKYGKAYSAFGEPLEMLNQDACTFYNHHSVYTNFGGVAVEAEEGRQIAESIGDGHGAILQNHGLITVGYTVDEAAYLFTLMERTCECQLLADAAANEGKPKKLIGDEEAAYTYHLSADRESLYQEFQADLQYEIYKDDSFMDLTKHKKN
ncbi:hypothetical protein CANARDRAFT_20692 [[Candida] arabinofermentans NRRL YB-2248]|uniref:Class II aldolase/adducin N-terminal domain-containing protein n=1 Tax=[Candida] arabinofermentans NRRL YB-2248 TaxID=983967 RepID=A0A1E4T879_9ASCO|nr:hypothetical protein CANARDRAFT_20692 [[Candida] arabinofermentans NRRL YB-2248]